MVKFQIRNNSKNDTIVEAIVSIRNGGDRETNFSIVYHCCMKIIFRWMNGLSDEYNSMVHCTLWDCILSYDIQSPAKFTTYFWGALQNEGKKIQRWEEKMAPQSEDGSEAPTESGDYCPTLENIIGSKFCPQFDGVYTQSGDPLFNVMSIEFIDELRTKYPLQMAMYEYQNSMHQFEGEVRYPTQKEVGDRFGFSQQYASRLLAEFSKAIGYRHKEVAPKIKGDWQAKQKRVSRATSSEWYDANGNILTPEQLHEYRMRTNTAYRSKHQLELV